MRTGPSGKQFDDDWREIPDGTPRSVSVDLRPKSMEQMVATYVAQAMALQSRMNGEEGAFEAEDLEVDEDGEGEILTPYELHAMAAEAERDARRRQWLREQMTSKKPGKPGDGAEPHISQSAPKAEEKPAAPPTPAPLAKPGGPGGGEAPRES